jgi:N-acetylglucosamine kinase-like BadF-type ATPase
MEKRKNIEKIYSRHWEKHFNMIRKGKFLKYSAENYHIEELVEKGDWSEITLIDEKMEDLEELLNMPAR